MSANVIVFGPTGAVGGSAAQEAASRGCKVWLAMRDTNKKLDFDTPESTYQKVQADLTDSSTIKAAIQKSGAKSAFIYVVHGADMQPTIQALKDAGVSWVVLLSSYSVHGDLRRFKQEDFIPYMHAQAEVALQEIGISYAALRPGYFASNLFMWWLKGLKAGELKICAPDMSQDQIVPTNIGQVGGALLSQPQPERGASDPEIVYLIGPKVWKQWDAANYVAHVMGKDGIVKQVSAEEWGKQLSSAGYPQPMVDYFVRTLGSGAGEWSQGDDFYEKSSKNVKKYSGKDPITFEDYVESVKGQLMA